MALDFSKAESAFRQIDLVVEAFKETMLEFAKNEPVEFSDMTEDDIIYEFLGALDDA